MKVLEFITLNAFRVLCLSFAVIFSILGIILFMWFPEFWKDITK